MTPQRAMYQGSRRSFNMLGAGIFLALTLVFGSVYVRDVLKNSLAQDNVRLGVQQANLAAKQQDLIEIHTHIEKFRSLKTQGLVGIADREGWVEQLVTSRAQLNAGDTFSYTLKPGRAVTDEAPSDQAAAPPAAADQAATNATVPMMHDLEFELGGTHEAELLDLLQDYRTKVHGRFRVQFCHFGNPTSTGLTVQCTLRFFNLPEAVKPQ